MKKDADSRATLLIVGNHMRRALARGDTTAAEGHMEVYRAILKAAEQRNQTGE